MAPREYPYEHGSSLGQIARLDVRKGLGLGELLNAVHEVEYYVRGQSGSSCVRFSPIQ